MPRSSAAYPLLPLAPDSLIIYIFVASVNHLPKNEDIL